MEREKGEPKTTAWTYCRVISMKVGFEGYSTYFALQSAETALEDVHDGIVDAFPVVDDFVVVNAGDYERWRVVFARLLYARLLCLLGVPSLRFCGVLLGLRD